MTDGLLDADNNGQCMIPTTWSCPANYYGEGVDCDCGCGAVDFDCVDNTSGSCTFVPDATVGGCSVAGVLGDIQTGDNSKCN